MNTPRLPDLERLSPAEKDALILSLWQTVQALDAAPARPDVGAASTEAGPSADRPRGPDRQALSRRIETTPASHRAWRRIGQRQPWLLKVLDYRPLQILLAVIGLGFISDVGIGWYQRQQAAARQQDMLRLEQAAFGGLYMELVRAGPAPQGNAYQATLRLQRTLPGGPVHVLQNPPRAFVQTGLVWREVPARAPAEGSWGMTRLEDGIDITVIFEADVEGWSELIPGYMHVQLQFDQLISLSSEPGDDIVERNNRFFFYLKPLGADDSEIGRRAGFRGTPPAFIPMPPH
ncbi:hypothetical protein J2X65_000576 [Ancylobacter sp. 3268]|uniref:hypothetical protein n=1 Tax=Ancylobacter sp. 3268 TaxID=2817752 RepID=UPI00286544CE|nr:hypothetical protein [Ancylobacter sp. 3268]MDR6951228.1 hypothetical protein [Ancylobacter sp. 3268]